MVRSMTSVAAQLTALAMSAAAPASAQPVDLLTPTIEPTVPANTTPPDIRPATRLPLPGPPAHSNEPPREFLKAARHALEAGQIGNAQEALERAETTLLNGSGAPVTASSPDTQHAILAIGAARRELAAHDRQGAMRAIDNALAATALAARVARPPPLLPKPRPSLDRPSRLSLTHFCPGTGSSKARNTSGCLLRPPHAQSRIGSSFKAATCGPAENGYGCPRTMSERGRRSETMAGRVFRSLFERRAFAGAALFHGCAATRCGVP